MMNLPWEHRRAVADAGTDATAAALDFPQRLRCFEPAWLPRVLREAAAGAAASGLAAAVMGRADPAHEPAEATVENVWYVPDKQLVVVYRLGGVPALQALVTVVFDPPGAADDAPEADAADAPQRRAGAVRLAGPRAWAWPWPHDPGGLALADWQRPAWAQQHLGAASATGTLQSPRLLSYLPGQRCALLWHDAQDQPQVVQKAQRGAAQSHAAMQALWQRPDRRFAMAEPLAADATAAAAAVRWERFVPGQRLEQAADALGWEPMLRRALAALVDLHASAVPGLPQQGRRDVLDRLEGKVLRRIHGALPALAPACRRLTEALASDRPGDEGPVATLHGDLHTGNLLVTPAGAIVFIDLDSLVQGAPAYDLALLTTRLLLVGLIEPARRVQLAPLLARIPQWYVEAGGAAAAIEHHAWHVAALLLACQIKTCIRHLAPGLPGLAAQLLALAERVHQEGELCERACLANHPGRGA